MFVIADASDLKGPPDFVKQLTALIQANHLIT